MKKKIPSAMSATAQPNADIIVIWRRPNLSTTYDDKNTAITKKDKQVIIKLG